MITEINEWKTLTKHIWCKCKCKLDSIKCSLNQKWNNNKCSCDCKNLKEHHVCKKDYIWNLVTCSCKHGTYLASIIDHSVIMCDEIIQTIKTVQTKTVLTKSTTTNIYISHAFLLIEDFDLDSI